MKKNLLAILALAMLCAMQIGWGYWYMLEREAEGDREIAGDSR